MKKILIIFCLFISVNALAEEPPPVGGAPSTSTAIPIDGGISAFLAAGAVIGGGMLFRKRKNEK